MHNDINNNKKYIINQLERSYDMNRIIMGYFIVFSMAVVNAQMLLVCEPLSDTGIIRETQVVGKLFTSAVQSRYSGNVYYINQACGDKECALTVAAEKNSNEVIFSLIIRLGNKFIFTATIMNNDGSNMFSQKLTTDRIEDFEQLCDRMAETLIKKKNVEETSDLDNCISGDITILFEKKEKQKKRKRKLLVIS